jgi:SAM-dependent methyltransferase
MKLALRPETTLERLALVTRRVPIPLVHALGGALLARAVIVSTRLGLFEALQATELTAVELAGRCGSDPYATRKLLDALVSTGYLARRGPAYHLTWISRKWLLRDSPTSLHDVILYESVEWDWLARLDTFVRTGRPLDFHSTMAPDEWGLYQRAMRGIAGLGAAEVARRVPMPRHARAMLDVGGSHGYYSVALCRRYPRLHATVLDRPEAIEHAAVILAREGMGDRVVHRIGDARMADLGDADYDFVLIAQLVHHFDEARNRTLVRRAARALRPGGYLVILEAIRLPTPGKGGQLAGLLDLYFAFTSRAGTWSLAELAIWQRDAGLTPHRLIRLRTLPGFAALAAMKPPLGKRGEPPDDSKPTEPPARRRSTVLGGS